MALGRRALLLLLAIAAQRQRTRGMTLGAGWITLGLFAARRTAAEAQAAADAEVREEERRTAAAQQAAAHEHAANLELALSDVIGAYRTVDGQRDAAAKHAIAAEQRAATLQAERAAERAHANGVERRLVAAADEAAALHRGQMAEVVEGKDAAEARAAAAEARTTALEAERAAERAHANGIERRLVAAANKAAALHERRMAEMERSKDVGVAAALAETTAARAEVNELRRTLTEQRRHDEERRRQVDVLLTQQLHQDLKLQGAQEAHRGLQIQAAKKDQQLALRDQQLEALRRRDEERQRQVDCLLDRELQMQLKLTAYEGERGALLTQAATWRRTAAEKDEQLVLHRQQADELYRCNDDKQRRLDCALTTQLHMQLERSALEGQCDTLRCEASSWRQVAMDQAKQLALFGLRVDELSQENSFLRQEGFEGLRRAAAAEHEKVVWRQHAAGNLQQVFDAHRGTADVLRLAETTLQTNAGLREEIAALQQAVPTAQQSNTAAVAKSPDRFADGNNTPADVSAMARDVAEQVLQQHIVEGAAAPMGADAVPAAAAAPPRLIGAYRPPAGPPARVIRPYRPALIVAGAPAPQAGPIEDVTVQPALAAEVAVQDAALHLPPPPACLGPVALQPVGSWVDCGPWHCQRMLGEGGGGQIHEVINLEDGRLAALKVMRLDDSNAIACAAKEATVLAAGLECCLSLEVNDGYCAWSWDRGCWEAALLLPLAASDVHRAAHTYALRQQRISDDELRAFILRGLRGLAAMHAAGSAHTDVKPGNLLVMGRTESGLPDISTVVVADFGLTISSDIQLCSPRGTVGFEAPEAVLGWYAQKLTHDQNPEQPPVACCEPVAQDLFGFGLTLLHLLSLSPAGDAPPAVTQTTGDDAEFFGWTLGELGAHVQHFTERARDDAWLRGVLEAAAAEGYGEDIVFMLARLLSLNPAERRSAAELHEFLLEQA